MATRLNHSGFSTFLLDPIQPTHESADRAFQYHSDARAWAAPLGIGLFFLVASGIGWAVDPKQFFFSYLLGWVFCVTISLGSLFFVLIHHITRAHWGVVVRRIPESLAWSFPLLALLSLPILFGMHDLYHWTHDASELDALILEKRPYLNVPFFLVRFVVYFAVWSFMAYRLYRLSVGQDVDPDPDIPARQRKVSAWGIPVFAVTTAFFSYDLVMSLDPHWFSTIFGVYIFAGAFWAAMATIIVLTLGLQRWGNALTRLVRVDHFQDLGKWLFAFTVFWAYIAYSQYMLIWYGNIPEEIIWYHHRLQHGWEYHSLALALAHFILPFLILLPRASKRSLTLLAVMSVWALVMQWFDLHWLIMPVARDHAGFHWLDFTCWLGLFGVYLGVFLFRLGRHSVAPQHDPYLARSLRFENV